MKVLYDVIELQEDKPSAIAKLTMSDKVYRQAFKDNDDYWPSHPDDINVKFIWKEEGADENTLMQFIFPSSKSWVKTYSIEKTIKNIFGEWGSIYETK